MRIVYHHRTRSTDAQRIHILEIVHAFQSLGHEVDLVSLVPTEAAQQDATRDAGDAWWKKVARRIPFSYELVQLGYNLVGIPLLINRVRRMRPHFIYERYSLFNFSAVVVGRMYGLPVILEVNSPFALEQSRDRDIRLVGFAQWTERIICSMATRLVVVSTPLARIMAQAGVDAARIDVMPNGVNLDTFRQSSNTQELRSSLGIHDSIVIGFVGWFRKWHGLEMLMEAFQLSGLRGRAKVLLVGDGQAMAELQAAAKNRGLEEEVIFTGPVPHADIPKYIDLIDIAVQPAANEYCCPMKILEYMALGKPIVAPRQENIVELLQEGIEAEFFHPGNAVSLAAALVAMARDRERAIQIGWRAKAAILTKGYLWTGNAQRVVDSVGQRSASRLVTRHAAS